MVGLRGLTWAAVIVGGLLIGGAAEALDFDFTLLDSNAPTPPVGTPGQLPDTVIQNGVTASGFGTYSPTFTVKPLWLRNNTSDHGLGVCNGATETCGTLAGPGDVNELDNLNGRREAILLDKDNLGDWTSLFVSSLDSGGTGGSETGTLYWASTAQGFVGTQSFEFTFIDTGGPVEVDLFSLGLLGAGFDASSQFLLFVAGPCGGLTLAQCTELSSGNNDYLVWKGSTRDVPEPGTLALLGAGLVGIAVAARRQRG